MSHPDQSRLSGSIVPVVPQDLAILGGRARLRDLLLELGRGFAFVGSQVSLVIGRLFSKAPLCRRPGFVTQFRDQ